MSDVQAGQLASAEDRTGVVAVDEVIASVDSLDGRPLDQHAEVYEQAHQRLRRALDEVDPDVSGDGSADHGR